jgi:hypothetical protein
MFSVSLLCSKNLRCLFLHVHVRVYSILCMYLRYTANLTKVKMVNVDFEKKIDSPKLIFGLYF